MIGCIATAEPNSVDIHLQDQELEDARWFTVAELREMLAEAHVSVGRQSDRLRVPPAMAIATKLISQWLALRHPVPTPNPAPTQPSAL